MIFKGTHLNVIDNSGAKIVKCIHIYGVGKRNFALPGDLIIISVRKKLPNKEIEIGDLYRAVVVSVKKGLNRNGGEQFLFMTNSVVLFKPKKEKYQKEDNKKKFQKNQKSVKKKQVSKKSWMILKAKGGMIPLGTRILSPVMLELRLRGFMRIISLATFTI